MKFVDEFREPELIRKTAHEIATLADPSRRYRLMEVCGGHTHAIYRFGLKDLLPPNIELIHGPGCPVCVLPMGRIDDGLAMAERSDVTLTAFGDMMRVPGTKGSPLHRKAQGMDVRIVYSPMDALKLAIATPEKHVIFFAIGFETTAPSTAFTLLRARALGVRNFSVFCNHVTIVPGDPRHPRLSGHASRRLHRSGPRLDGDRLPPLRVDRQERREADRRVGLRAARHPAGDPDGAAAAPPGRGARREPVPARRAMGRQHPRAARDGGGLPAASIFRVARHGLHFAVGAAPARRVCRLGRRGAIRRPRHPRDRSQSGAVRRSAERRADAGAMQAVRQRMHAGASHRRAHGVVRGIVRRLLQLRAPQARRRQLRRDQAIA